MERFCKDLREHVRKVINNEKTEMIQLTDEENKSYEDQKICYIYTKEISDDDDDDDDDADDDDDKKYQKARDHCHCTGKFRGAAHNICNLRYKTLKEFPLVFHNCSTYDYHFIINQLVKEFKGQVKYLGENTEKYITFSVPIRKIDNGKTITYK